MDKQEIAQLAHQMKDKNDLLVLLNRIKQDELSQVGLGDRYHPFTMRHINYYCNPNHAFRRYNHFQIKKKSGGFRQITAPRNRSFKSILRCLNELLKAVYTPSQYAMGFTEGRSVVDNAARHIGMNYVFNIDLKDFFPSVEQPRIWKRLQLKPFNFPIPVASVIAGMCCMREECEDKNGAKNYCYVLPQGAPTSPILTNIVCDKLDFLLSRLARKYGLNYTRYADDITFSSMHNVYHKDGEFCHELFATIKKQNFNVNPGKTRLQKIGSRQEVTGIVVSSKLNVTKKYVREIRNLLYIWEQYGYGDASARFLPVYKQENGHVKKGNPNLVNVLDGKLMYLKMVKGEEDLVYQRLHAKFSKLSQTLNDQGKTNDFGITYVNTTPLLQFEKTHKTEINFELTASRTKYYLKNGKTKTVYDFDVDGQPAVDDIERTEKKPGYRYAEFKLGDKAERATVNKNISKEEESKKEKLAISKCRNEHGEEFWLVHKLDRALNLHPVPVDIDELNNDLDSLLNM